MTTDALLVQVRLAQRLGVPGGPQQSHALVQHCWQWRCGGCGLARQRHRCDVRYDQFPNHSQQVGLNQYGNPPAELT